MDYIEIKFFNDASLNEVIIAWLSENDYDMFEEREDGLNAYINAGLFSEENLVTALSSIPDVKKNIRYEKSFIKDQNWNKKWESNFEPVIVAEKVYIRAPFHNTRTGFEHELIIEPKMSFGTGHHATTALMIELMLHIDFKEKEVLDMGCGTGVLAILAEKLGAENILGIDIDDWACENSIENISRNNSSKIQIRKGDIALVMNQKFDIILANINRNILLTDMEAYSSSLKGSGSLLLSGILMQDKEVINNCAASNSLSYISEVNQANWIALHFKKNTNAE